MSLLKTRLTHRAVAVFAESVRKNDATFFTCTLVGVFLFGLDFGFVVQQFRIHRQKIHFAYLSIEVVVLFEEVAIAATGNILNSIGFLLECNGELTVLGPCKLWHR
jgi:hypothetical protein